MDAAKGFMYLLLFISGISSGLEHLTWLPGNQVSAGPLSSQMRFRDLPQNTNTGQKKVKQNKGLQWPTPDLTSHSLSCPPRNFLFYLGPFIGLPKGLVKFFHEVSRKKPEQTFWPMQYNKQGDLNQ